MPSPQMASPHASKSHFRQPYGSSDELHKQDAIGRKQLQGTNRITNSNQVPVTVGEPNWVLLEMVLPGFERGGLYVYGPRR